MVFISANSNEVKSPRYRLQDRGNFDYRQIASNFITVRLFHISR
jgi:hypothetical protein